MSRAMRMHKSHPHFSENHSSLPCKAHACFLELINKTCNHNQGWAEIFSSALLYDSHPKILWAWTGPCEETRTHLLCNPAGKQLIWHSTSQEHPHILTRWNVLAKHYSLVKETVHWVKWFPFLGSCKRVTLLQHLPLLLLRNNHSSLMKYLHCLKDLGHFIII